MMPMSKSKRTRKAYEEYLNTFNMPKDSFIMAGKYRVWYDHTDRYGTCMRKYDPIQFNTGYNEWRNNDR